MRRLRCRDTSGHDAPPHHIVEVRGFEPLASPVRRQCGSVPYQSLLASPISDRRSCRRGGPPREEPITGVTVHDKMLRLELLQVKADLERELQTWSLNGSNRGLDVHWVGGLGVSHLATGRTGSQCRTASLRSKSTNGGSPPARGRGGRSSDVAETDVVPAPYSGQTDCPRRTASRPSSRRELEPLLQRSDRHERCRIAASSPENRRERGIARAERPLGV
jgi:hypothetical protein